MPTDDTTALGAWARPAEEVARALGVRTERGLSDGDVRSRQARYGANALREIERRSAWGILWDQLKSLLVGLLAAACAAALIFGEWVEAGAIFGVLILNTLLGFVTELKAARSMEALRKMGAIRATVRRDGEVVVVPAQELVPGDVVVLEGGDVVTADLRIVEASKLQANESTLTGESVPVGKSARAVKADAPLGEREGMLFKGTVVTRGSGLAIVVATGMQTELGRISALVEAAKSEMTPLEKRLNRLGQRLVVLTFVIALLLVASGIAAGRPLYLIIETAIALAVATVPEGLPIIATIALARGMHRMAKESALINRLSAVETLGATNIICTDKTGTLTQNRMRVEAVVLADPTDDEKHALELGVLCNNASLGEGESAVGDPLELALLVAGEEAGIDRDALLVDSPEVREVAFDPEVKMMATVHGADPPHRVAVKGAPEAVLAASSLDAEARRHFSNESERLAEEGLRVLAVAERTIGALPAEVYANLSFVGLIGMRDPPREGVSETIALCRRAGLRVVMATGDHPVTAKHIAIASGLVDDGEPDVVMGADLDRALRGDEADRRHILAADVFARVSPEQKLDLIELHQADGSVVAMTGDGVNDAPALRKADIGVAMGGRGTAAAKEAADMVLEDDDLSTIAIAIGEGRAIVDNIRNFVVYLLSCNLAEVLVVGIAAGVGAQLPLLPLQILFLNLVTDVFPALALGVGEAADDVMSRPPRPPKEPILSARHWRAIVGHGLTMTASVLGAFAVALVALDLDGDEAVTVSFLTIGFAQLWHVFDVRRPTSGLISNEITRNRWVWGAIALCIGLLLLATYLPPLAALLRVVPPGYDAWLVILVASAIPVAIAQTVKVLSSGLFSLKASARRISIARGEGTARER